MVLSPDPMLSEAQQRMGELSLGGDNADTSGLINMLSDVLGIDLKQTVLAGKVSAYFKQLAAGPGAVRATLQQSVERFEERL
jgi:fructuronate reductase